MPDPTPVPVLDVLLPVGRAALAADPSETDLSRLYAHPAPRAGRTAYVRANMVTTLDGAATGPDHVSGSINNPADLRVFRVLRAMADVVLIGAGTARAEGYRALRVPAPLAYARSVRGQHDRIELAVVTATGSLPPELLAGEHPPLVITVASSPGLASLRELVGADRIIEAGATAVDLPRALAALAVRGLTRVLAEGGPHLLADLLAADAIDELCVTTSPLLVGGPAARIVATDAWLAPVRRARAAHVLHSEGVLLARWLLDAGQPVAADG